MKKIIKVFSCICIGLFILLNSIAAAAIEVNSHEANIGDIVTYEIHAAGCSHPICGIDISITYDSDALEYTENSIEFPYITGYFVNDKLENEIRFNSLSLDGFSFYEDHVIASVSFRVISDYAPYLYVKYNVNDFTDADFTDLGDEYTYVVTNVTESNEPFEAPQENDDSQIVKNWENNSSKTAAVSEPQNRINTSSTTSSALIEKTVPQPSYTSQPNIESEVQSEIENEIIDDTADEPETFDIAQAEEVVSEQKNNYYKFFIIGGIAVVFAAVVIIIISKSSLKGEHMS